MRVFVTGASGHIASAVIPELLNNGHQVVGLARSEASADTVATLGAEVRPGDLDDLDGLRAVAAEADGVIHLAFKHEAMLTGDFMGAVDSDMAATQAIGETLIGTGKPFVSTGGTLMLAMAGITGRPGTEDDQSEGGPRIDAANYTRQSGAAGRALLSRPARADGPQRPRPSRLHARADRLRPRERRCGLHWRRQQPLAGGEHIRHWRALPPGVGEGPRRLDLPRRRGHGHLAQA